MPSIGVVLAVRNRLRLLVSYKTPPGFKPEPFVQPVEGLIAKLNEIQELPEENRDLYDEAVELAYEVESAVEYLYLKQAEQPHDDHHPISSKTKHLTTKIIGLARQSSKSLDKIITASPSSFSNLGAKLDDLIKRFGKVSRTVGYTEIGCASSHPNPTIIGLEEDIGTLQDQLKDGVGTRTITIAGMAGIGKTTLARKLFDLTDYNRAWVHVGDNFHARDVAVSIFQQLTCWECSNQEIQSMDTAELIERIYKAQQGKKCLVVLDDVWTNNAWDTIRLAFPSDHGARIIITTRDKPADTSDDGYRHEMIPLDADQTWELFKAQQSQQDLDTINEKSEEERTNIVSKVFELCGGLPLAINVLGGLVRRNGLDWYEKLLISSSLESENAFRSLDLSYKHLPFQLKECLLYVGLFPEDRVVPVEKLYLMWMSECLIPPTHHEGDKTGMDTAQSYLNELVQRKLVMTMQKKDLGVGKMVESCELHDQVRDTYLSEGIKEGFIIGDAGHEKRKRLPMLRIAVDVRNHDSPHDKANPDPKHVRSLIFFEKVGLRRELSTWPVEVANLNEYRSAKVLDFDGVNFRSRKLPKGIEKLEYLRYLGFRGCHLEEFPLSYDKFPFLETLDLRVETSCKMNIPNVLWKFSCLLHLFFPLHYQGAKSEKSDKSDKLKLSGLTRLETLVNFHAGVCNVSDLEHLKNLRKFVGIVDSNNDVTEMIKFIEGENLLSPSSLSLRKFDCYSEERFKIFEQVLTTSSVHALDIEGHLAKLPSIKWGEQITEMFFNGSEFKDDPLLILGKLPQLTSLVFYNDAFIGNKMECFKEDFPKLTYLKLSNLWALEELVVEDGAMSHLSTLKLQKCRKLRSMSPNLIEIKTLQEVRIRQMSHDFLISLKDIPHAAKWLPITL